MIGLVLAMLRSRRGQALTLLLLTMLAVGATVAVPAYLRAVDAAVVRGEVAAATPAERSITVSALADTRGQAAQSDFDSVAGALLDQPGFDHVYAAEFHVLGLETGGDLSSRAVYRQDVCAHLRLLSGRCLLGSGEILVGDGTARRLELAAGDRATVTYARIVPGGLTAGVTFTPDGPPAEVTIAGIYRPADVRDQYWGAHDYFAAGPTGEPAEPVFTDPATVGLLRPKQVTVTLDATAGPGPFADVAALRAQVAALQQRARQVSGEYQVSTGLPALIDRVEQSRALGRRSVPAGAVPLLLLAYLALYLAVDYGSEGRRPELAVVALRGARWWHRLLLATGETVAAILCGAVAGFLAGRLAVGSLVAWRLPGIGTPVLTLDGAGYAAATAAGAVLVAVAAQRAHLARPVAELLRRVRLRASLGWRAGTVVAVLAAGAVVQLFTSGGRLDGVGMLAAALCMVALAVGCAHLLAPAARAVGRWGLRRGRLGVALAALQAGRRPAAQRMLLLLTAAVAVLGYAVSATDVAARDRDLAARIGTGGARVLSVGPVTRQQLLYAVHRADPQGRYAMAVAQLPPGAPGEPSKLAVDAARLPAVVPWLPQYGGVDPAQIPALLHPPARDPVVLDPGPARFDVDVRSAGNEPVRVKAVLTSVTGRGSAVLDLGAVTTGPYTLQKTDAVCRDGCRLAALKFGTDRLGGAAVDAQITLRGLSAARADLADAAHWRATGGTLTATGDGLRFAISGVLTGGAWIQPADAPYPLPVLATVPLGPRLAGLDDVPTEVREAGRAAALPRLGTVGAIVDLEYADRISADGGGARFPEVWLSADAPPDLRSRLSAAGLIVTGERDPATARARLDAEGPALALWFHLFTAALAILLAAGGITMIAAVDRASRAADQAALRRQGLPRRTARRAALWTYPLLVVAAGVLGLVVSLAVWRLTGWALPIFGAPAELPALPLPTWPVTPALPAAWLGCVALLTAVAARAGAPPARATP
ncbi:FtsX-like permease family protein [Dactylosporangium sp. CA-139066]|uniref:FtsX-like permease family protein n=1 Tax=Dactylosporangium sp. CA-139066 TaxID=3239930 RepID=UPI003D9310D7